MTNLKNIKVYDTTKLLDRVANIGLLEENEYFDVRPKEVAIIEGSKGIFVFDWEAVGNIYRVDFKKIVEFGLYKNKKMEDNKSAVGIIPSCKLYVDIDDIKKECLVRETTIRDFVRQFGSRLEYNFHTALETINEIGLDSKDYYRG